MSKTMPALDMELRPKEEIAAPAEGSTAALVLMFERMVRDPAVDVEKLDRLMQLHERTTARLAQEQFYAAMSEAQKEMRSIAADAYNPQTRSRYASYAALDAVLRPIYTKHGFGMSFDSGDAPAAETVRVLCDVSHIGGHKRTYKIDMPSDGKGAKGGDAMTRTHATGAAAQYGMRYLVKMIWNVAVGEADDDGNGASAKTHTPEPPAGFQDWWDDMKGCAESDGEAALRTAWSKSRADFRAYLTNHHIDKWEALKATARKARP